MINFQKFEALGVSMTGAGATTGLAISQQSDWGAFGLVGLVIFALFYTIHRLSDNRERTDAEWRKSFEIQNEILRRIAAAQERTNALLDAEAHHQRERK